MSFELDDIVPWGRSFEEYRRMFALSPEDLSERLIGCGDGPASFNAEATRRDVSVVSVDPLYAFSADAIKERIEDTHDEVLQQLLQNQEDFVWTDAKRPERLVQKRLETMDIFLDDYRRSKNTSRYVAGTLPTLPFADGAFDLALCSHLLFLYSDQLGAPFHIDSIREMLRVAREVRVYPLLTLEGTRSPHVEAVLQFCREQGQSAERVPVDYEFQRGADHMLVVHRG
jgi:hypothetical protein